MRLQYENIPTELQNLITEYIADAGKTPVFLINKTIIEYNFQYLVNCLKFSKSHVYFSVKTNNNLQILSFLKAQNCGFEIASFGEMLLMKELQISPERIIFSNPVKIPEHIKEAHTYGINLFAFDTENELKKIAQFAPNSNVFLRLAADNSGADWELLNKFGAQPNEAISLLKLVEKYNLKAVGISVHVGWNNKKLSTWLSTLKNFIRLYENLLQNNIRLDFVNLGGGFPAHQTNQYVILDNIYLKTEKQLNYIRNNLKLNIIAEPGSFICTNAAVLLLRIYDIVQRAKKCWLFVDSGICQGFYWILSGLQYPVFAVNRQSNVCKTYVITGPTLDSHDIFCHNALLPENLQIGDYLAVFPAGAYTNSSINYNGFSYPPIEVF